ELGRFFPLARGQPPHAHIELLVGEAPERLDAVAGHASSYHPVRAEEVRAVIASAGKHEAHVPELVREVADLGGVTDGRREERARGEGLQQVEVTLPRLVEAGQEAVHDPTGVARADTEIRDAGSGAQDSRALRRPPLESAHDRGARGHDAAAASAPSA